ncbi:helix-turn-helix domain-containing protein [Lysinibacillus fusiformis]|uniref:helix-turn-helix domain-containing protein n=1 Tax=Lysinibacillus fusiformis TaxID=28031 RepID=UPI003017FAEE
MKQYLKLELLVELPADLEVELIKPPTPQVDNTIIVEPDKKIIVDLDKKMTMSVDELAEELQISTSTIYTMVRQNEIPHKKVRGRILFHRPTIEEWLMNTE